MEILQSIALDFARKTMPITVFAKQYDKDTRKIEITPLNNGAPYTLENSVTARLQMTKPDGTTVIDNATIASGKITVTLTGQCLTAAGTAVAEVGLYKDLALLTSQTFFIEVEKAAYDENAPKSSNEYAALIRALEDYYNKVDKTREIAGIDLQDDITKAEMKSALDIDDLETTVTGKVDKTRTIAGIALQADISALALARALEDPLIDDLDLDSVAYLQTAGATSQDKSGIKAGQYYYTSDKKKLGIKISASSQSSTGLEVIEAYSTGEIDSMIGDIESLLALV